LGVAPNIITYAINGDVAVAYDLAIIAQEKDEFSNNKSFCTKLNFKLVLERGLRGDSKTPKI